VAGIVGLVGCTLKRPAEGNPGSPDPARGLGARDGTPPDQQRKI